MVNPGKLNLLRVVKILDFGIYLDAGEMGEVLMPTKWVPEGTAVDDHIEVFIYFDSEDRPIATTLTPRAMVGEFAFLKAKQLNQYGAFLDWGLDKDLLVPYKEQNAKMIEGRFYLVYLYIDTQTTRIVASARLNRFLDLEPPQYSEGEQVDLIIWTRSPLGYNAIINRKHTGMLYENQVFTELQTGTTIKGYVTKIREDGKIDIALQKPGYEKIDRFAAIILKTLEAQEGYIALNDKSPAEQIAKEFGMSKKNFKKAIGALYKNRLIIIEEAGIRLASK